MFDGYSKQERQLKWLKRWIWVYFWLLIFEGVLRKWVVPSLSSPLLLIRDPVVMILYVQAYRYGKMFRKRMWPIAMVAMGVVLLAVVQVIAGINTIPIALFGLHSYALHLPLIFVIADTLDEEDIYKVGRWLLLLSIPMTALVLAQFVSPSNSWLNAGAGKDSGQIFSAGGHIRPAGTFSYVTGMQCLVPLVAPFILDALMRKGRYPNWLVWGALLATVATIPALGSRTVLFTMALVVGFTLFSGMSHASHLVGLVKIAAMVALVGFIAIQIPVFHEAVETMTLRWQQAGKTEGGVQDVLTARVLGVVEVGLESAGTTPLLGRGIGMSSSFASLQTSGELSSDFGDTEWERVLPEFGSVFGLLFMSARVGFAMYIILRAYRALKRNAPLAWLLVPAVVPILLMSIMEQATYLGFMVFGAGVCLAASRIGENSTAYSSFPLRTERIL